jgi:hypothetical protein
MFKIFNVRAQRLHAFLIFQLANQHIINKI